MLRKGECISIASCWTSLASVLATCSHTYSFCNASTPPPTHMAESRLCRVMHKSESQRANFKCCFLVVQLAVYPSFDAASPSICHIGSSYMCVTGDCGVRKTQLQVILTYFCCYLSLPAVHRTCGIYKHIAQTDCTHTLYRYYNQYIEHA